MDIHDLSLVIIRNWSRDLEDLIQVPTKSDMSHIKAHIPY